MFGKDKDDTDQAGSGAASSASGTRKSGSQSNDAPSIISADMKVVGDLQSGGDVQIEGSVEGDIQSRTATIGENAQINGSVNADTANIHGRVNGKINATIVRISKTADVRGDINYQTLSIEEGAVIDGQVKRKDDGAKSDAAKKSDGTDANVSSIKTSLAGGDDKPSIAASGAPGMKPAGGKPLTG